MNDTKKEEQMILSGREIHLVEMIRNVKNGEVHIYVYDGKPVKAEEIKRKVTI